MSRPRCLIACEFSGTVRTAFAAAGWDAWSCDLLPSETPGNHVCGDVLPLLGDGWDLLIAHPSCQYLCNSGVRWLKTEPGRMDKMHEAAKFFRLLLAAPIPRIAIENPIPHKYAVAAIGRQYDFTLQPYEHGEPETKRTCFWTVNLPPLVPSNIVPGRSPRVHHASPGPDRWKERSRTLPGVALAFATQWGSLVPSRTTTDKQALDNPASVRHACGT